MSRMNKIEDLLQKEIAKIIICKIDNPDIKNTVTITGIKVSRDLRSSIVYFTTLLDNHAFLEDKMNSIKPVIKHHLSKSVYLKRIPDIKFIYDDTQMKGEKINKILENL